MSLCGPSMMCYDTMGACPQDGRGTLTYASGNRFEGTRAMVVAMTRAVG